MEKLDFLEKKLIEEFRKLDPIEKQIQFECLLVLTNSKNLMQKNSLQLHQNNKIIEMRNS